MKTKELARELGLLRTRLLLSSGNARKSKSQEFSYLIIIDFESTCWKDAKFRTNEIIEFPAVLLNTSNGQIENEFQYYVQPEEHPTLSDFCRELTGITQDQVDNGIPLRLCLKKFSYWLDRLQREKNIVFGSSHKQAESSKLCTFVTWSDWDLGVCLFNECKRKQLLKPSQLNSWIDLRATYRKFYDRKPAGLNGALQDLGIEFQGREHSGLHDSRNTAHLAYRMMCDGCKLTITKTIKGRAEEIKNSTIPIPVSNGYARSSPSKSPAHKRRKGSLNEQLLSSPSQKSIDSPKSDTPERKRKVRTTNSTNSDNVRLKANMSQTPTKLSNFLSGVNGKVQTTEISTDGCDPANKQQKSKIPVSVNNSPKSKIVTQQIPVHRDPVSVSSSPKNNITVPQIYHDPVSETGPAIKITRKTPKKGLEIRDSNIQSRVTNTESISRKSDNFNKQNPVQSSSVKTAHMSKAISLNSPFNVADNMKQNPGYETPTSHNCRPVGQLPSNSKGAVSNFKTPTSSCQGSSVQFSKSSSGQSTSSFGKPSFKTPVSCNTSVGKSGLNPRSPFGYTTPNNSLNSSSFRTPNSSNISVTSDMKSTPPLCRCGRRAKRKMAQTPGPNCGRFFFTCGAGSQHKPSGKNGCGYFQWESSVNLNKTYSNSVSGNSSLYKPFTPVFNNNVHAGSTSNQRRSLGFRQFCQKSGIR